MRTPIEATSSPSGQRPRRPELGDPAQHRVRRSPSPAGAARATRDGLADRGVRRDAVDSWYVPSAQRGPHRRVERVEVRSSTARASGRATGAAAGPVHQVGDLGRGRARRASSPRSSDGSSDVRVRARRRPATSASIATSRRRAGRRSRVDDTRRRPGGRAEPRREGIARLPSGCTSSGTNPLAAGVRPPHLQPLAVDRRPRARAAGCRPARPRASSAAGGAGSRWNSSTVELLGVGRLAGLRRRARSPAIAGSVATQQVGAELRRGARAARPRSRRRRSACARGANTAPVSSAGLQRHDADAGLRVAGEDRPLDRRRAAPARQQREVQVHEAVRQRVEQRRSAAAGRTRRRRRARRRVAADLVDRPRRALRRRARPSSPSALGRRLHRAGHGARHRGRGWRSGWVTTSATSWPAAAAPEHGDRVARGAEEDDAHRAAPASAETPSARARPRRGRAGARAGLAQRLLALVGVEPVDA